MKFFQRLLLTLCLALSFPIVATANAALEASGKARFDGVLNDYRTVISSDFGGGVTDYIEKYNKLRQSGAKVRVDDLCMSACTLILGLVPKSEVCVSPFAQFAFHSAYVNSFAGPQYHEEATRLIWNIYPEDAKVKIRAAGWDGGEHPNFVYVKGSELYEVCKD